MDLIRKPILVRDHLLEHRLSQVQLQRLLGDLREAVAQVYNDQNGVSLDFLREATVSERNQFLVRVPAVTPLEGLSSPYPSPSPSRMQAVVESEEAAPG